MKKYTIAPLLMTSFILSGSIRHDKTVHVAARNWTGTVSFFEKKTGPKIVISEWKMDAIINDDVCNVIHSYRFENTDGDTIRCRNEENTALEVGFDEEKGKYYVSVRVPGCNGVSDETEIAINDQPIPTDRKVLAGMLLLQDGPDANGDESKTTYRWHLEKDKNNP